MLEETYRYPREFLHLDHAGYGEGIIAGLDFETREGSVYLTAGLVKMGGSYFILPQAVKLIIPTLVNEFVVLIKDTSLLATIGAVELFQASKNIGNTYYDYMSAYTLVIPFYLVMTLTISYLSRKLEKRLSASD